MYAENHEMLTEGPAFLVEVAPQGRASYLRVQGRPARTNLSGQPLLTGWAGSTNNVSVTALGVVRITRAFDNGRVRVTSKVDTPRALRLLGFEADELVSA